MKPQNSGFHKYVYIFIAIALDETNILVKVHFSVIKQKQHLSVTRSIPRQRA